VEVVKFVFIKDKEINASIVEEPLFVFIIEKKTAASIVEEPLFVFIKDKEANASTVIYPVIYIQLLPNELLIQKFHEMENQQRNY